MALDYDKLINWPFPEVEQAYDDRDSILYALSLGFGSDPMDRDQLSFVWEEAAGFRAAPTMPVVLARPGQWNRNPEAGLDWRRSLHAEQGIEILKPIPTSATVVSQNRITEILDKGREKGALLFSERTLTDKATGELYARMTSTSMARGDGGFGGKSGPQPAPHPIPERQPDAVCDLTTQPNAALFYRLPGADPNPLHADPEVAEQAGFRMPILHGLCTWGVVGHALLKTCCGYDTNRFRSMQARFSAPVYPGETIRTEIWSDGNVLAFRAVILERDERVVLNNGCLMITD